MLPADARVGASLPIGLSSAPALTSVFLARLAMRSTLLPRATWPPQRTQLRRPGGCLGVKESRLWGWEGKVKKMRCEQSDNARCKFCQKHVEVSRQPLDEWHSTFQASPRPWL